MPLAPILKRLHDRADRLEAKVDVARLEEYFHQLDRPEAIRNLAYALAEASDKLRAIPFRVDRAATVSRRGQARTSLAARPPVLDRLQHDDSARDSRRFLRHG